MMGDLTAPCWTTGSIQVTLFPVALVALLGYSVVLPLLALLYMRAHRVAIKHDQLLRVSGLGYDRLTNPKYYQFRRTWGKLYYHMLPGKWYWELVICARKFLLAFTVVMFRDNPGYQLAMALLVLFVAYVLHTKHQPYLTHLNRASVLTDHAQKMLTDPLHASIEADMRAIRKQSTKTGYKTVRKIWDPRLKSTVDLIGASIFEYNTAEALLLGSAILVCLSGLMFSSSRFSGPEAVFHQGEYNSLTGAVVALFAITLIYYVSALVFDFLAVLKPDLAASCCACASQKASKLRLCYDLSMRWWSLCRLRYL
jgi:hypothetical protein